MLAIIVNKIWWIYMGQRVLVISDWVKFGSSWWHVCCNAKVYSCGAQPKCSICLLEQYSITAKHEILNHCWFNDGPSSTPLGHHWTNNDSMFRVCWDADGCTDIIQSVTYAGSITVVLLLALSYLSDHLSDRLYLHQGLSQNCTGHKVMELLTGGKIIYIRFTLLGACSDSV